MKNTGSEGGQETPEIDAKIKQSFQSPILTTPSNYIVAVERFQVHLNGIPFYEPPDDAFEEIIIRDVLDDDEVERVSIEFFSWSEVDTCLKLSDAFKIGTDPAPGVKFTIDQEGIVRAVYNSEWATDYYLDFSEAPILNEFLGLNGDNAIIGLANLESEYPRWDTGDQLDHIRITTSIPVVSDTIGQDKSNILTDFIVPKAPSANIGYDAGSTGFRDGSKGIGYTQRQKLTFSTSERRYINMSSDAPVYNFRITAEYVKSNGEAAVIPLPRGCLFSIKLGFYKRT